MSLTSPSVTAWFAIFAGAMGARASLISTAVGVAGNNTCNSSGTTGAKCSGTYSTPYGNDSFSASSSSSYTMLSNSATTGSAYTDAVYGSASSSTSDLITLGGVTGSAYADFTVYYNAQGSFGSASATFDGSSLLSSFSYYNIVVPVTFADPFSLSLSSQVSSFATYSGDGGTYDSVFELLQVSLFSDARLTNPITSYTYESQSGALYPFLDGSPTSVPEPASAILVANALLIAGSGAFVFSKLQQPKIQRITVSR